MGMLGGWAKCYRRVMRRRWDTPRFGCVGSTPRDALRTQRREKEGGGHALTSLRELTLPTQKALTSRDQKTFLWRFHYSIEVGHEGEDALRRSRRRHEREDDTRGLRPRRELAVVEAPKLEHVLGELGNVGVVHGGAVAGGHQVPLGSSFLSVANLWRTMK